MDWDNKFDNALWACQKTFETLIGVFLYHLVYEKAYYLSVKLEYKALWVLKRLNMEWRDIAKLTFKLLNNMVEFHLCAFKNSALYKEKMKLYPDHMIKKREFTIGDRYYYFIQD